MARELQALQADLFRSGDLVECHVLLASTLLAEKAEKKWLSGVGSSICVCIRYSLDRLSLAGFRGRLLARRKCLEH